MTLFLLIALLLFTFYDCHGYKIKTEVRSPPQILSRNLNTNVVLTVTPRQIPRSGVVTLSWQGVEFPTEKDIIAIACGPKKSLSDVLRFVELDNEVGSSGSKEISDLTMHRCNYTFHYVNYGQQRGHEIIHELEVPMEDSINAPRHGHISLTSAEDEMAVMFNSGSSRTPEVLYGTTSGELTLKARGTSTTYKAKDMCAYPANEESQVYFRNPGFMHKVIMNKLSHGTRYYYKFGNDIDGWSEEFSFMSRPHSSVKTTKILAYGDMGASAEAAKMAKALLNHVNAGYESFLIHFGDVSYALGQGAVWDQFFNIIEPFATKIPYMVSIGNHEYDHTQSSTNDPSGVVDSFRPSWGNYGDDSWGECSVPMFHRFTAPDNGNGIYWYSFNYGGIHVIQMSTEHDFTRGSIQYNWIENDLKAVDRNATPWVILAGHRMMYTTQTMEEADYALSFHFREEMEDMLFKYEVNLMLVGHQHSYERSCNVYQGQCRDDNKGTVHIIAGAGGFGLEPGDFSPNLGKWSVAHANLFGFLRLETSETEMHIEYVKTDDGGIFDSVVLHRWSSS